MSNLLFFTKMNFGNRANSGIKNKVYAQVKAFEELGFNTTLLSFENKEVLITETKNEHREHRSNKFNFLNYLYFGYLKRINLDKIDYVYIRHFLCNPLFIWMLRHIKKRKPSIKIYMELPTYPYRFQNNKVSLNLRFQQFIDDLCTPFFKKYIDHIVTISLDDVIFGIPTIKTDNGIDINTYSALTPNVKKDDTLHLLGLANVQSWHGFDRILDGLYNYNTIKPLTKKVILHIVGNGDALSNLKNQTEKLNISSSVIFHGFLGGQELENMFKNCQVGIGVLGLHRVNLKHASALKAREFSARGLPFIASHDDFGYPDNYPFILKFPANDEPIQIEKIINFYTNLKKEHPDYHLKMHEHARKNFTWESKLKPVADKFQSVS